MARRQKQPAIILDRDGVLIDRPLLTWRKSQMKLSKGIAGEIKFFNEKKVPVIVITNQSVVARGLISEKGVVNLHELLNKRLKKSGAHVDKFYFCPHHPSANLKRYRVICQCRKPKIGLFKKAVKELNLNLRKSVTIGDMTQDILAGKRAKTTTILIESGRGGRDYKFNTKPDYKVKNVIKALRLARRLIKR